MRRSSGFGATAGDSDDNYSHSLVLDVTVTDDLNYVIQSDLVAIDDQNGAVNANDQVGVNQYLFYTLSDRLAAGSRVEWWKTDGISFQEATFGLNYKSSANLTFRPEIRYDWTSTDNTGIFEDGGNNQTTFGMDAVLTF